MVATKTNYKGWILKIEKLKGGMFGVFGFKNRKPQVVSFGVQQCIGIGKTKQKALDDAKDSVDKFY